MNIIERIIADKARVPSVKAKDEITVPVDLVMAHDVTGPMAIEQFYRIDS